MKRMYIVTANSEPKIYRKDTLLVFAEAKCQCKKCEIEEKTGISNKSLPKWLDYLLFKASSLIILVFEIILKIPIISSILKFIYSEMISRIVIFVEPFIQKLIIFIYLTAIACGTVSTHSDISLYAGIFSIFLSIFYSYSFSKYGDFYTQTCLSFLLAYAIYIPTAFLSKTATILPTFFDFLKFDNIGNTLTGIGVIISIFLKIQEVKEMTLKAAIPQKTA